MRNKKKLFFLIYILILDRDAVLCCVTWMCVCGVSTGEVAMC